MLLILIGIIATGALGAVLVTRFGGSYQAGHEILGFVGATLIATAMLCVVVSPIVAIYWFAAEHKAKIINAEYGKNYTQAEIFYASDVIDQIRHLDRKRYEINGDIARPKQGE